MARRSRPQPDGEREHAPTAHELLAPTLLGLSAATRAAAERVATSAEARARGATSDDAEAVHDLRVALRRLRTLLRPARAVYGKRRIRAVAEHLRRFAQATGVVRDEEVLHETLAALTLPRQSRRALDAWVRGRARHERDLRTAAARSLTSDASTPGAPSLLEALAELEASVRPRKAGKHRAAELASRAIAAAVDGVREAAAQAPSTADSLAMHALRIREKRLRYTAEIFASVLPGEAARVAKDAARMQKRLGELHDLDHAIAVIQRARSLGRPARPRVLEALWKARAELGERLSADVAAASALPYLDAGSLKSTRELAPAK